MKLLQRAGVEKNPGPITRNSEPQKSLDVEEDEDKPPDLHAWSGWNIIAESYPLHGE